MGEDGASSSSAAADRLTRGDPSITHSLLGQSTPPPSSPRISDGGRRDQKKTFALPRVIPGSSTPIVSEGDGDIVIEEENSDWSEDRAPTKEAQQPVPLPSPHHHHHQNSSNNAVIKSSNISGLQRSLLSSGLCYDIRMRYHCEVRPTADVHPEDPRRIYYIYKELCRAGLVDDPESTRPLAPRPLQRIEARNATMEELCLVHSPEHYAFVESTRCMYHISLRGRRI